MRALGEAITTAAETTRGAKPESIRVVLTECAPDMWFVGGRTLAAVRAPALPASARLRRCGRTDPRRAA
ncbi:tautomerase family protein [Streptomyces sp. NBC_00104]